MPRATPSTSDGDELLLPSLPPDGVSHALPPPVCGVRFALMVAVCTGITAQTALRSVPNLVMNGEHGMAKEFGWGNAERGMILSSFGWGYTIMQLPGGIISQLLGPRRTMFCFALTGSVAGLAMPYGARALFSVPLALNFIIGMGQAPTFPVLNGLLANWLRQSEMARGNALMMSAWNLGQVIQFLLSPVLLTVAGWPLAWYLYAGICGAWCLLWLRGAADTPESHPRITQRELDWINEVGFRPGSWLESKWSIGTAIEPIDTKFTCRTFMQIVCQTQVVVLSLCSALDGLGGAFANWLPQYYTTQLHIDLQISGLMTGLPMVVAIVSSILGGLVSTTAASATKNAYLPKSYVHTQLSWLSCHCSGATDEFPICCAFQGGRCSTGTRCVTLPCAKVVQLHPDAWYGFLYTWLGTTGHTRSVLSPVVLLYT